MPLTDHPYKRFLPFLILALIGALAAWFLINREWSQMKWEIPGAPDEYPLAQQMRPIFISVACFLPCLAALAYAFIGIMDRYISRLFLSSFLLCTAVLTLIFILGDFAENAGDYGELQNPLLSTIRLYALQLPMVLNIILPYTLLLGVLWTLSKLSASSEITGMLQSGRSLLRITAPILIGSCIVAIYFGIFGFYWAPNANLYKRLLSDSLNESKQLSVDPYAQQTRYRNDADNRIWNIRVPPGIDAPGAPLQDVHIEQFSSPGKLQYEIIAQRATWNPVTRVWTFHNAVKRYHPEAKTLKTIPVFDHNTNQTITAHFTETPWQLISPSLRADTQSTPQIIDQLANRTVNKQFARTLRSEKHVRFARIFSCIILAFIAIPSAITFQRRSAMAGIGIAIFLAAAMLFLYEFFPSLAAKGYLMPWLGAWLPNIIYIGIAIYLFNTKLATRTPWEWLKTRREEAAILARSAQASNLPR